MTNEDTPADTDGDADGGTFKVVTASTTDDGLAWGSKTSVSAGAHWPGLYAAQGKDGASSFLALYGSDSVGVAVQQYSIV